MSLDKLLKGFRAGQAPTHRDLLECVDLAQEEVDRIDGMIENVPTTDERVVITMDGGPKMRFSNIDALAKWLYPDVKNE